LFFFVHWFVAGHDGFHAGLFQQGG